MIEFVLPDLNDSISQVELDEENYRLRMTWNSRDSAWFLSMFTDDLEPVAESIRVIPNYRLLDRFNDSLLPSGDFVAIDLTQSLEVVGRDDFVNGACSLIYFSSDELEDPQVILNYTPSIISSDAFSNGFSQGFA